MNNTETIYQCNWVNDDMDGDCDVAPRWCGYYGEPEEVTETYWICANCGTERKIEED